MNSRLTIVLPLKGRFLFTLRFLWHANKARLPYRFLIADGEVHPELARLLEDSRKTFPELDLEYIRYPNDTDLTRFYAKMVDVLQRVSTSYVKIADNDDFLAHTGLECCMNFLDSHDDYVCCGGGIAGFSVHVPLCDSAEMMIGPFNKLTYRYSPRDRSIDLSSPSATDRVLAGVRNTWSYYAVFRTSALAAMWKEILEMDPTSFQLGERFLAMRALILGKARSDPSVFSYVRQYWTSSGVHWTSPQSATRKTFIHHLLRSRFTEDVANVLDRISRRLAELDGGDSAKIADCLRQPLEQWVGDQIRLDYGAYATLRRHLRTYTPWLVAWLKRRHRLAIVVERRSIFKKLRNDGATPEYIAKFKRELTQIEGTLVGREFKEFLDQHMLKLQAPR